MLIRKYPQLLLWNKKCKVKNCKYSIRQFVLKKNVYLYTLKGISNISERIFTQWLSPGKSTEVFDRKETIFSFYFFKCCEKILSQVHILSYFLNMEFILFQGIKSMSCEVFHVLQGSCKPSAPLWFISLFRGKGINVKNKRCSLIYRLFFE